MIKVIVLLIITFSSNVYAQQILSGRQTVFEHETEVNTPKGTVYSRTTNPPIIKTQEKSCIGLPVQCKLMEDSITLYNQSGQNIWTVLKPDMSTQSYTTSSNPFSIPDSVFNVPGKYRIFASSQHGLYCDPEFAEITIVEKPPKPMSVQGEDLICVHYPYYYTTNIVDNTLMHWHLTGANDTGFVAHSGSVTWNTYGTKNMILYREWEDLPGCISDTFVKQIHNINLSGNISGVDSTFEDMTNNYVITLNGIVADVYEWYLSPSSAGNISGGQGTSSCVITWLHQTTPTVATLSCKVTKCGTKITISKNVFIDKSAEITSFTVSPNPVCSGAQALFDVKTKGAPVSKYIFDFGDGTGIDVVPSVPNKHDSINHVFVNTGSAPIIYQVKVKVVSSNNGLVTSVATVNITVYPQPNSYLSPASPLFYPGDTLPVIIYVSTTNSTTNTYTWYYKKKGDIVPTVITNGTNNYYIDTVPPFYGEYWCVVTNSYGCSTETNRKIIDTANGGGSITCTPLAPAGINAFPASVIATSPCGSINISCNTLGDTNSITGNITGWNWAVSPSTALYTTYGTGSYNHSPAYSFQKAGLYKISLTVLYKDSINPSANCGLYKSCYVTIPMVAEFIWGFGCLPPNLKTYQLLLYDYSSIYPGYSANTRKWEIMDYYFNNIAVIYANNKQDTLYTLPDSLNGKTIYVRLTIEDNQSGITCTKLHSITIPDLPVADFTLQTTYTGNPANPYKSCEGRAVQFINNSSPISDIHTHIWDFNYGIPTHKSYMVNTFEVYEYDQNIIYYEPKLTVTDKYGCKDDTSVQIQVFDNTLKEKYAPPYPQYDTTFATSCPYALLSDTIKPLFTGGVSPLSYQWYKESEILNNVISPYLTYAYRGSGAYWVQISDTHNCYLNLNPTPALVSVKPAPTAIISGKEDICDGDDMELWVNTGMAASAPLSYLWSPNGYTTKKINPILNFGANPYSVTVTDNTTGCTAISTPFTVNKYHLPASPAISGPTVINCADYELELSVANPVANYSYTWSTGLGGPNTSVYNGGAYRLWVRDTFGCVNHNDIAIPYPADYYFWRFPTGCYSFCPDELPKRIWPSTWVYGNQTQLFASWAWIHDGNLVGDSTNGPMMYSLCNLGSSFGVGNTNSIPCRLFLGEPVPQPFMGGEGDGDYSWELDNHLCKSKSDILSFSIKECCNLELNIDNLSCISVANGIASYEFTVLADGIPCPTQYNLSGENNFGFPAANNITVTSLTTSTLIPGFNIIKGTFTTSDTAVSVKFKLQILCEDCYGETQVKSLPKCHNSSRKLQHRTDSMALPSLSIIPNPANDKMKIIYNFTGDKFSAEPHYVLNIYNVTGELIDSRILSKGSGSISINTSVYGQGVYYAVLMLDNVRIKTGKFIIYH